MGYCNNCKTLAKELKVLRCKKTKAEKELKKKQLLIESIKQDCTIFFYDYCKWGSIRTKDSIENAKKVIAAMEVVSAYLDNVKSNMTGINRKLKELT